MSSEARPARVVVELLQQQDVGTYPLDDLGDRARLRVVGSREIAIERAQRRAIETGVERGDADESGFGGIRSGGGQGARRREDQKRRDARRNAVSEVELRPTRRTCAAQPIE